MEIDDMWDDEEDVAPFCRPRPDRSKDMRGADPTSPRITLTPQEPPRYVDAARDLLAACDRFMSGQPITPRDKADSDRAFLAASFAMSACRAAIDRDHAAHALLRAFLTALFDPASRDLDYLRACSPEEAEAMRAAAREKEPRA